MEYILLGITAFAVALLSFFSGFGLGALLLPAFAFFFPLELAVAATAIVHLANNLFKFFLVGRYADKAVALRFGIPAALAAFVGAQALLRLAHSEALTSYALSGKTFLVEPINLTIGPLIIFFALFNLIPRMRAIKVPRRVLPVGGLLSGFFGGLSGHQGALRSAFLIKAGLDRNGFIGTTVVCAILVDLVRLSVYGSAYFAGKFAPLTQDLADKTTPLLLTATFCAFAGSFGASRLIHKVTLHFVQYLVGALLLVLGTAIAIGIV